jgi:hypothetical protein
LSSGKDTLSVKTVRRRKRVAKQTGRRFRRRVHVGAEDASLTGVAGVAVVAEFVEKLDVVGVFDRWIGPIKQRARGVSAGQLLVGLAQSQLLGGDALVALDRQRRDTAAAELSAVPGIPSTSASSPTAPASSASSAPSSPNSTTNGPRCAATSAWTSSAEPASPGPHPPDTPPLKEVTTTATTA